MNMQDADQIPMPTADATALRRKLLAWYRKHRRAMPWRAVNGQAPAPYHVLVSEAMLQQTQVATVIPYFERFIKAFPTIEALAEADEQRVLTLWQGLGYYRRARHLYAAAKVIVERFDSQVPDTVEQLLELPGVGRYTAGAVASIAHGTRAAVVDGNVERVLSRLLLIEEPINAPATKNKLWPIAESLVPKTNPGDYNQSVMELGAMVCTPKAPKCCICPVRAHCRAVREADPDKLPVKLAKKKPKAVTHVVVAAERNGKYLFEQRPSDGLWSNMWQLPTWEDSPIDVFEKSDRSRRVTAGRDETLRQLDPRVVTRRLLQLHLSTGSDRASAYRSTASSPPPTSPTRPPTARSGSLVCTRRFIQAGSNLTPASGGNAIKSTTCRCRTRSGRSLKVYAATD
ncbi:MAG: A/G-specific adenine glycosylase [Phycisphaeraceae bacterium]